MRKQWGLHYYMRCWLIIHEDKVRHSRIMKVEMNKPQRMLFMKQPSVRHEVLIITMYLLLNWMVLNSILTPFIYQLCVIGLYKKTHHFAEFQYPNTANACWQPCEVPIFLKPQTPNAVIKPIDLIKSTLSSMLSNPVKCHYLNNCCHCMHSSDAWDRWMSCITLLWQRMDWED